MSYNDGEVTEANLQRFFNEYVTTAFSRRLYIHGSNCNPQNSNTSQVEAKTPQVDGG